MIREQIQEKEEQIRQAQLRNDVAILDRLISDRLQFVFLDGSVAGKRDDLDAHRNKVVIFQKIEFSEQRIEEYVGLAVVTVKARIEGLLLGKPFAETVRYCRTWAQQDDDWRVVAGSVTQVP